MYQLSLTIILAVCLSALSATSQDVPHDWKDDVERLSSRAFMGRGYLFGGADSAANLIRDRFRMVGLDSLDRGYFHTFPLRVNEFPVSPSFSINGVAMELGRDFLPHATSGTGVIGADVPVTVVIDSMQKLLEIEGDLGVVVMNGTVDSALLAQGLLPPEFRTIDGWLGLVALRRAVAVVLVTDRLIGEETTHRAKFPIVVALRERLPLKLTKVELSVRSERFTASPKNVIGFVRGTEAPDSFVVITAHYDHLGSIGPDFHFPGANDNASGTAMVLDLASRFATRPARYTVVFVAVAGEEAGLVGSQALVRDRVISIRRTRFLLNIDMAASGAQGITAVGGNEFAEEFRLLQTIAQGIGIGDVRPREQAPISDHHPFVVAGARAFYVYPFTGLQPYHHVNDVPQTLEPEVYLRLRHLFETFIRELR